jgi:hypothetical protein
MNDQVAMGVEIRRRPLLMCVSSPAYPFEENNRADESGNGKPAANYPTQTEQQTLEKNDLLLLRTLKCRQTGRQMLLKQRGTLIVKRRVRSEPD